MIRLITQSKIAKSCVKHGKKHRVVAAGGTGLTVGLAIFLYANFLTQREYDKSEKIHVDAEQRLFAENGKIWHGLHSIKDALAKKKIYVGDIDD